MFANSRWRSMRTWGVGRSEMCIGKEPRELRRLNVVAGKDRSRVLDAEVPHDDLAEDVAKVRGDGEVAPVVPLLDGEPRPFAVHPAASDAAADRKHRVAVTVIG